MREERSIKILLIIFCSTYVCRVIVTTVMYIFREAVVHLFEFNHTYFMVSVLTLWLAWDSLPLIAMMVTHYKNFSSFSNEEILYTEYTVDDHERDDWILEDPNDDDD